MPKSFSSQHGPRYMAADSSEDLTVIFFIFFFSFELSHQVQYSFDGRVRFCVSPTLHLWYFWLLLNLLLFPISLSPLVSSAGPRIHRFPDQTILRVFGDFYGSTSPCRCYFEQRISPLHLSKPEHGIVAWPWKVWDVERLRLDAWRGMCTIEGLTLVDTCWNVTIACYCKLGRFRSIAPVWGQYSLRAEIL